ncbi:MAG: 4-hydroxy-3-methylbut-2-en-1-yl diphosphate synthase [Omnitrophica bacterium RIFCSPLOWO2_12_FULL_44_17]|uniref:4-hydroxy-3-methylbut-2-en-1-yl diphosphate synthase (flavodoxin) n=1 Tax=Candidatus Danuiimicrobium aquiferis TaxID=1801832 RepID=A0A1G1KT78_9BACT|nr:MAG: 4-hydroxy-3-methylbut-2-en-1-yl diphosphate synthase [Omnitrophica bacterium RIFCSPHIGHO2_02_FULL_45_28]OGW96111.1 MAG: 4-hydroxy-3-methylbut-2-en-1-yl diphosphate synthase [Omnitrophica bacterium RIFCSPLOWO2_12_FULL_44_17]OGX04660.1 MAG: 4-hydroxy-3-methylbut-2-en-1-yl diphosphate synthase [Omnitrophica bacterium RIFCSPLOWO2_02_FULL_44_11]
MTVRKKTKQVKVGVVTIGGGAPIRIQSMCTTPTRDVAQTVDQIQQMTELGCEIARVACLTEEDARVIGKIRARIKIPLVADIQYHFENALIALEEGIDKLRLNPGNIGARNRVKVIVKKAKERGIPIRIGVNGGSLEKEILEKYKHPTPKALVESAKGHVEILEEYGFSDIVISMKSSDVLTTIEAYRLASKTFDYPLHVGVTEAGTLLKGAVANAIGVGTLLQEGIGDTIRVSLSAEPTEEIKAARFILESLNLRKFGAQVIACPRCGRAEIDVFKLANEVESRALKLKEPVRISVMGCAVNGPGEAMESDFGITGGKGKGMIYVHGKQARVVPESELVDELFKEIEKRKE